MKGSALRNLVLQCGHVLEYEAAHFPQSGEVLWCPRCRRVQAQESDCYSIKCQNCRYARSFGTALLTAQTRAGVHVVRNPGHVVHLVRGRAIVSKHGLQNTKRGQQLTISDLEPPPF